MVFGGKTGSAGMADAARKKLLSASSNIL